VREIADEMDLPIVEDGSLYETEKRVAPLLRQLEVDVLQAPLSWPSTCPLVPG
jgi:hypothetical protein